MSNNVNAKVVKMNVKAQHFLVNATPAELEKANYDDLRDAQNEIRNQIPSVRGAKQHHLEEQFCFIARELEFRSMSRAMHDHRQASRSTQS